MQEVKEVDKHHHSKIWNKTNRYTLDSVGEGRHNKFYLILILYIYTALNLKVHLLTYFLTVRSPAYVCNQTFKDIDTLL